MEIPQARSKQTMVLAVALALMIVGVSWLGFGGRSSIGDLATPSVVQAHAATGAPAFSLQRASAAQPAGASLPMGPGPYSVELVQSPGGDPQSWMLYFHPIDSPVCQASR
jgi:hypothetical protein